MATTRRRVVEHLGGAGLGALGFPLAATAANDTLDTHKAVVRRFYEIVNSGDSDAAAEVLSQNYRSNDASDLPGIAGWQQRSRAGRNQTLELFESYALTIEDMIAEAAFVAVRGRFVGSRPHTGLPDVDVTAMYFFAFDRDKIARHWASIDAKAYFEQLFAEPAATPSSYRLMLPA